MSFNSILSSVIYTCERINILDFIMFPNLFKVISPLDQRTYIEILLHKILMKLFSIYYTDVLNVYIIEEYGEKNFLLFRIEYLKRTERT